MFSLRASKCSFIIPQAIEVSKHQILLFEMKVLYANQKYTTRGASTRE